MYRTHWGLRESPFRTCLDVRYFYPSPTHDEALARLHFLVEERLRVGLLIGEAGSGKSLILEYFARELRRTGRQVASINLARIDCHQLIWMLAAELGLSPEREASSFLLWRAVIDRMTENRYQQLDTVLLLDDADDACEEVLHQIIRLSRHEAISSGRLTVVLAANGSRFDPLHTALLEMAELRVDLDAWEEIDTSNYVNHALRQAGRQTETFTVEAIRKLHQLCGGIPRKVTQLANLALVAGAGKNLKRVDAETVESVFHELAVVEVAA